MKVSVLIPAFNASKYLPECLSSICNQTYKDLQIIVVDDGSTDDTWALLQQYAEKDSRVEVYHQENAGVAAARNALLSHVCGDYFLFVDADDCIEPDMVSTLLSQIQEYQADIAICGMVSFREGTRDKGQGTEIPATRRDAPWCVRIQPVEIWNQEQTIEKFLFHKELSGSLWNKLADANLLHSLRFREDISYGEDALFCWQLLQRVSKVVKSNLPLYHYRMNTASISHASWSPDKKGTGHIVWNTISTDTARLFPHFQSIADDSYAVADMWNLYYAAQSKYPKDSNIREYQKNLRNRLLKIISHKRLPLRHLLFAVVAAYSYSLAKILSR